MDIEKKELYVAADKSGEFTKINDALDAARDFADREVTIHIAPGIYHEELVISQNNITFLGTDAQNTVITFAKAAQDLMPEGDKRGTFRTATVLIDADFFRACHISFRNEAGQGAKVGQALAVYADGDHLIFEDCRFEGFQDTLFTAPLPKKEMQTGGFKGPKEFAPRRVGRQLYQNCYISGNVDFIFGGATAFFEHCEIFMRERKQPVKGFVTAPSTFEGQKYGYVFDHCRFTSECPKESAYLGRPWRNYGRVVILHSEIGAHIRAEGWHDWDKKEAWNTVFFAEYGNYGEGAGTERAPFVKILTREEAEDYTRENVLGF